MSDDISKQTQPDKGESSDGDTGSATSKPPKPYAWGRSSAVIVVLVLIAVFPVIIASLLSLVPHALGWSATHGRAWLNSSPWANFLYVLATEMTTIGGLLWFMRRKKMAFARAVGLRKPRWWDVLYAGGGIVAYFLAFALALAVTQYILPLDTSQQQALGFQRGVSGVGLVLAFVSLVILPPLAEETLFRGFFYGTLRAYKTKVPWAALITSLFFGFFHLFGGASTSLLWVAFLDTFVLSLVLCYLREKTGSIWAGIFVHALKNGFVFINLFIISSR